MQTITSSLTRETAGERLPYLPSFVDRLMGFVQALPLPYWLTYFLLFFLQSLLFHVICWIDGWIPPYTFSPMILIFPMWLWLPLMLMTHLNSVARQALSGFSSLLDIGTDDLKRLEYEFTTMPAGGAIMSAVFWVLAYSATALLTLEPIFDAVGIETTLRMIVIVEGLISYTTGSAIYYHSLRQLLMVNRTVKRVAHFNLFQLEPVYAFSRLTSRTGIAWMFLLSATLLMFPLQLASSVTLGTFALQVVLAIAAFILPLWVVHQRLLVEKRTLTAEHHRRVETVLEHLHHALDAGRPEEANQHSNILHGLDTERGLLAGIPTWPWRESTLTGFLSAIVLPVILLLVQIAIQKWLGG